MAIKRRQNWLGQQRIDVPHLRSLESAVSADFDSVIGSVFAGRKPLVVRGFKLVTTNAVGSPATSLQLAVANSAIIHYGASESGSVFETDDNASPETLDTSNAKLTGGFIANTVNYVGLNLTRTADPTTADTVFFLDANTLGKTNSVVPLARVLDYRIIISTLPFDSTTTVLPIAKVTTDASNNVTSLEDARKLYFRLGSGGSTPNTGSFYSWPGTRYENTSGDIFSGGDKAILSDKDWRDAIMTRLWELGGGEYWYSAAADRNVRMIRSGAAFASGDYFEVVASNLHWKGLTLLFDNSTGIYNDIADQTTDSPGLTDLADDYCIYVDVDRTQNLTGASALVPKKTKLTSLGTGAIPGSRFVIAWRHNGVVYTRDFPLAVGNLIVNPATTAFNGTVTLNTTPLSATNPIVPTIDAGGSVLADGISRPTTGTMKLGTDTNTTGVTIGRVGVTSVVAGILAAADINAGPSNLTLNGAAVFINGTAGNVTIDAIGAINIGTTTATGIAIGRSTKQVTVYGPARFVDTLSAGVISATSYEPDGGGGVNDLVIGSFAKTIEIGNSTHTPPITVTGLATFNTGVATDAHNFKTPQTFSVHVSAAEMYLYDTGTTGVLRGSAFGIIPSISTSPSTTGTPLIGGRVRIPIGATITSISFTARNTDTVSHSISSISIYKDTLAGTTWTATLLNSSGSATATFAGNATTRQVVNLVTGVSWLVTDAIVFEFTLPIPSSGTFSLFYMTVTYTLDTIRPNT